MKLYDLKIACPDRPGIIAAIAGFIHSELSGNILDLNHHSEEAQGLFFLICRFSIEESNVPRLDNLVAHPGFIALQQAYIWQFALYNTAIKPRIAALVTQTDHCLYELILKVKAGYCHADLCCIISNRDTLEPVAKQFGLPFYHLPVEGDKALQEARIEETLAHYGVETVVLARYMQVLSPAFVGRWQNQILNVHHGFLPAFKGARPYHQAWARGVKIIGATAHYATVDLDEGPILYQDVASVRNNLSIRDLIERGQDIERKVLIEGLKLHLEHRVFLHEGRTIIL